MASNDTQEMMEFKFKLPGGQFGWRPILEEEERDDTGQPYGPPMQHLPELLMACDSTVTQLHERVERYYQTHVYKPTPTEVQLRTVLQPKPPRFVAMQGKGTALPVMVLYGSSCRRRSMGR